ncbi:phosphatidylethanolamine N-methyltransferase [Solemya pervernicosa gill symbiont]|uniref:Phosphatidylethanolamine N-methyltransferase n=2 Tax=Gammaproteobacteria incertae sedis TaxID=118884 RepID=A0A1T2L0Z9_9GAMM|nr:methyltransferase domain-containing protein [Candidatus Reidiella endopervernicosa]OOZ38793.1 phosphatidylethanolamine N-methyltransferase [Solemya pervernicosa gill symbiont]QKQ25923.1 methyltransferase domain-containing protein [Candidatus Reidiella endopervernicosa]
MSLRFSYTLIAPIYDLAIAAATAAARRRSLDRLGTDNTPEILLSGIGSGLDLPYLPSGAHYHGIDITPAMLKRAERRATTLGIEIELQEGDAMALPYGDEQFDIVVMHLILAVVPEPQRALAEAARVLRPGGRIVILDKFLRPDQRAPLRRMINPLIRHIATRTDVIFEEVHASCPNLQLSRNEAALAGGWFRHIELEKR